MAVIGAAGTGFSTAGVVAGGGVGVGSSTFGGGEGKSLFPLYLQPAAVPSIINNKVRSR